MDCFHLMSLWPNHQGGVGGLLDGPRAIGTWSADSVDFPGHAFDHSASLRDPECRRSRLLDLDLE